MKNRISFLSLVAVLLFYQCSSSEHAASRPASNDTTVIDLADPTIFSFDSRYYLYGTVEGQSGDGFLVYVSSDLIHWNLSGNNEGYALRKGDAFGTAGFWAPQVFYYAHKFYMAYVANENIAIAESDSPLGPFKQSVKQPMVAEGKQIDPFIFLDDDGKKYLYHVRLLNGNRIFVAELADDLSAIKPDTRKECISATDQWENTAATNWPVTEGPSVLKHKGRYYLFYTANDFRNPDYATGYAMSNTPYGPWTKYAGNPILSRNLIGQNGTGHGDFLKKGKAYLYVFHTHNSGQKVGPRKTAIVRMKLVEKGREARFITDKNSFRFLYK